MEQGKIYLNGTFILASHFENWTVTFEIVLASVRRMHMVISQYIWD